MLVLVAGPPLAGVDAVIAALRAALPEHAVVGNDGLEARRAPDAVVAVVSAVAPMTRSDWDLIAHAAARTHLVVGAVSKIDAHRTWRDVLATNRTLGVGVREWVGVAAAPQLGESNVADLVAALCDALADPALKQRNMLKRNNCRSSPATVDSRVELQRLRLRLLRFVRDGCASLRTELRDAATGIPADGAVRFEARVRDDVARFAAELDGEITREVGVTAAGLALPRIESAPCASRRLETRLMAVLGLGFGLGIALAASRLLAGLAPGLSTVGLVAGAVVGSALVWWVVRARGVLHDRALLDRWVTEVTATLRWHGEGHDRRPVADKRISSHRHAAETQKWLLTSRNARRWSDPRQYSVRNADLNRSCEGTDILPIYRGYVTHVNLYNQV